MNEVRFKLNQQAIDPKAIDGQDRDLLGEIESYRQELLNIAEAKPETWDCPNDFRVWAQSRARFALSKHEVTP